MKDFAVDFSRAPLLVIWEITRACELACPHCRASAINLRDPRELSLDEGRRLIRDVRAMGTRLMVLTGGDPLQRADLEELIACAREEDLTLGVIPAATERLTRERLLSLKNAGLKHVALSLDGPTAHRHDEFRQVEGTFERVMLGAKWARELGLSLQINTVFGPWNLDACEEMARIVSDLGAVFWEVFLLVPVGRGTELPQLTPEQCENLFSRLCRIANGATFVVKVTEGQHHRRFMLQHPEFGGVRLGMSPTTVNAGRGFCFIDHTGDVCPSGFLPIVCGNVRDVPLAEIYRNAPVFKLLRDSSALKGRCGRCPYRDVCTGGSRARAYALTGDFLESDPWCAYEPVMAG